MTHEMTTTLAPDEVLERAKAFFPDRAPHHAAFLEKEGARHATFRGQGGEELTVAVFAADGGTRVRASTLFYDQSIGRFFSTLPAAPVEARA
ncbi:MAG: hypothetical protein PVF27_02075 [Gemmatimonadales bacterium]|jgi:hypothetical protein